MGYAQSMQHNFEDSAGTSGLITWTIVNFILLNIVAGRHFGTRSLFYFTNGRQGPLQRRSFSNPTTSIVTLDKYAFWLTKPPIGLNNLLIFHQEPTFSRMHLANIRDALKKALGYHLVSPEREGGSYPLLFKFDTGRRENLERPKKASTIPAAFSNKLRSRNRPS